MPDPYTWLNAQGQVVIRTEDSYAAYENEDGQVVVRPAVGLVEYNEDDQPVVWVPVEIDTPEQPAMSAEMFGELEGSAVVDQEIAATATHDNEIGSDIEIFQEISGEATLEPGE
jgi:hypothetical protein